MRFLQQIVGQAQPDCALSSFVVSVPALWSCRSVLLPRARVFGGQIESRPGRCMRVCVFVLQWWWLMMQIRGTVSSQMWCRCSHFPMRSVQPAHAHHPNFDLCMWFTAHGAMTMVFYISQVAQCVRMGRHRGMTLCTYTGTGSMHG